MIFRSFKMRFISNQMLKGITAALLLSSRVVSAVTLDVATSGGNSTAPLLYGLFFEEISYSGDGGLHGNMIRNNGFQGEWDSLDAYDSVSGTSLAIDYDNPLSNAIPRTLKVNIPPDAAGLVGFQNSGYWGMRIDGNVHSSQFFIKGAYAGDVVIRVVGTTSGIVYGEHRMPVVSTSDDYTYFLAYFWVSSSPDGDNHWELLFEGEKLAGSSINVALPQFYGKLYKDRFNGLREDLATTLEEIGGRFLRFPGGSNLQGWRVDSRWKWNETIGSAEMRPGRQGVNYANTDAIGLQEYFQWAEDMSLAPILVVWSGQTFLATTILTGDDLEPYIDDAIFLLEFLIGDTTTPGGGLRALYGRPEPYQLTYVEIGNEDFAGDGCALYGERFMQFYNAIHPIFPQLTLITSADQPACLPPTLPEGVWKDAHLYLRPGEFVNLFNQWDNYDRSNEIFVGEYAAMYNDDGTQIVKPYMQSACAEAVYMLGMERNPDLIKLASYAPLLEHHNHNQWTPNLIGYDSRPGSITPSVSYYVQQMFARNYGTTVREVASDSGFGPVYWVSSIDDATGTYFVKLANYGESDQSVTINIPGASSGKFTLLTGPKLEYNRPFDLRVTPQTTDVSGSGSFQVSLPPYAVAVLAVN